jgi:HSP20 family protein
VLIRTDPFRQLDRFATMFEQSATVTAPMDAYRLGDVITAQFELPGVDPETIDLQIERGELRLSARRRLQAPEGAHYLVRERTEVNVTRRLLLGETLDVEHVDAEFHDGILTVRIPLRESAKPRRVDVRHSAGEGSSPQRSILAESSPAGAG